MSRSLNKVMLIGNVGAEPEISTTQSGVMRANLSIATNKQWNDRNGQKQEKTEWHRLTAWDKVAEIVEQYVHKGDRLYVEGELEYSQTEDQQGNVRYFTNINVRQLIMLGLSSNSEESEPAPPPARKSQPAQRQAPPQRAAAPRGRQLPPESEGEDDDLPF